MSFLHSIAGYAEGADASSAGAVRVDTEPTTAEHRPAADDALSGDLLVHQLIDLHTGWYIAVASHSTQHQRRSPTIDSTHLYTPATYPPGI